MSNLICYDSDGNTLKGLYQWDYNQTIKLTGADFSGIRLVHFTNHQMKDALVLELQDHGSSELYIDIPNIMLQYPDPIIIYLYKDTANDGYRTLHAAHIPIYPRQRPQDYILTDNVEYMDWVQVADDARMLIENLEARASQAIDQALESANTATEAAEIATATASEAREATAQTMVATQAANDAASDATSAANSVDEAKQNAQVAADNANSAAQKANSATVAANQATNNAESAADDANTAALNATEAASNADKSTNSANSAADTANNAAEQAILAANDANKAAEAANNSADNANSTISNTIAAAERAEAAAKVVEDGVPTGMPLTISEIDAICIDFSIT